MHENATGAELPSRRDLLAAAGLGLTAVSLTGCSTSDGVVRPEPVGRRGGAVAVDASARRQGGPPSEKTTYLPPAGSRDPAAWSLAENLFWTDILAEHALFFTLLMPGDELAAERQQAKQFQNTFTSRFERARATQLQPADYAAFNSATIEVVEPFVDWKRRMQREQESGKLQSLVWPTFFDHTAREAARFVRRLEQFNGGSVELEQSEAIPFWAGIMGEHADFIAHLLDPTEKQLVEQALQTARTFYNVRDGPDHAHGDGADAAQGVLDFKTAAEKGINAGSIKSIIHPALAAHVRREATKFVDELKRLPRA